MPTGNKPPAGRLAVVTRNVASLRAEPKHDSEQITQALIGQNLAAEAGSRDWLFVQTWDTYRGWINTRDIRFLDESVPYASRGAVAVVRELITDVFDAPHERAEIITKATISSELEVTSSSGDWVELRLPEGRTGYIRKHEAKLINRELAQAIWLPEPRKLAETAMRFVGVPYLWGGTSPFGLDCSGFVQLVYRIHSVTLLRDANMQWQDPRALSVEQDGLRPGDLVFFGKKRDRRATHVGMVLDDRRLIHASGALGVTITPRDDPDLSTICMGAKRIRLATLDRGGGAPED